MRAWVERGIGKGSENYVYMAGMRDVFLFCFPLRRDFCERTALLYWHYIPRRYPFLLLRWWMGRMILALQAICVISKMVEART